MAVDGVRLLSRIRDKLRTPKPVRRTRNVSEPSRGLAFCCIVSAIGGGEGGGGMCQEREMDLCIWSGTSNVPDGLRLTPTLAGSAGRLTRLLPLTA
jgi:hypothetical protein